MIDEQQVERAGAEPVFAGQRVEGQAAVADRADHTRDPVANAGVRPDTPRHFGVGGRALAREHRGRRSGAGDSQRAVAAVGPQFQRHAGVGAADRGGGFAPFSSPIWPVLVMLRAPTASRQNDQRRNGTRCFRVMAVSLFGKAGRLGSTLPAGLPDQADAHR